MSLARALGLLGAAYLGMILSTAFAALWSGPVPDFGFMVALYAGLHCRPVGGPASPVREARPEAMAGLGVALGYLMDLVGGTPRGLHALACAAALLGLRALSSRLFFRSARSVMAVAMVGMLLFRVLVWSLHAIFAGEAVFSSLRSAPGEALGTGLFAPLVFSMLRRLDIWLWRDTRAKGLTYESAGSSQ